MTSRRSRVKKPGTVHLLPHTGVDDDARMRESLRPIWDPIPSYTPAVHDPLDWEVAEGAATLGRKAGELFASVLSPQQIIDLVTSSDVVRRAIDARATLAALGGDRPGTGRFSDCVDCTSLAQVSGCADRGIPWRAYLEHVVVAQNRHAFYRIEAVPDPRGMDPGKGRLTWGRIGTVGQQDLTTAGHALDKAREKLAKGYTFK